MMIAKSPSFRLVLILLATLMPAACSAEDLRSPTIIDFSDVLRPHYEDALNDQDCGVGQPVSVRDDKGGEISFRFATCGGDAEGEWVNFFFVPKRLILEDYVFGTYKYETPKAMYQLNPSAPEFLTLDLPIFGVTNIGSESVETYLKTKKMFHKIDWTICQITKQGDHLWRLENTQFKAVPDPNYRLIDYSSVKEWEEKHEADEVSYNARYGGQRRINRACGNNEGYWYVMKRGVLLTIASRDEYTGGVIASSFQYKR